MSGNGSAGEQIEGAAPAGRRWTVLLGVGVLVVGLAAGAVVGVPAWQRHQDRAHQQQAYDTGHAALLAADCVAAVPALRRAASTTAVPGLAPRAAAEQQQCVRHLAAVTTDGTPPERLLRLAEYLTADPTPPTALAENARERGAGLLEATAPTALTENRLCASTDTLAETGLARPGSAPRLLPKLLLACVTWVSQDRQDPNAALDWLERLRTEYPASAEARGTGPLTTRLWVQTGRYFHSEGTIDQWEADPSAREGSGRVRLELDNDGREPITLRLAGPQVTEVTFPACQSCPRFRDDASARCLRKGPSRTVLLAPGTYELVTGDQRTRLKYGRMTLRAHDVYRRCFYSLS